MQIVPWRKRQTNIKSVATFRKIYLDLFDSEWPHQEEEREIESIVAGQIDAAFVCKLTADKARAAVFVFRWPFLCVPHCHFDVLSYNGCLPFSARAANKISRGGGLGVAAAMALLPSTASSCSALSFQNLFSLQSPKASVSKQRSGMSFCHAEVSHHSSSKQIWEQRIPCPSLEWNLSICLPSCFVLFATFSCGVTYS